MEEARILAADQNSGVLNRQDIDNHLGGLIHPPGNIGQQPQPQQRSMNIDSINARVLSQGGRAIAVPREMGIIPQLNIEARIPARPARIPAVVSPMPMIVANDDQLRQLPDDPFLAAILRIAEAQATHATTSSPFAVAPIAQTQALLNSKVAQETRTVELANLMEQHKFLAGLPATYPNKDRLLETIIGKILATNLDTRPICLDLDTCPICLEGFEADYKNTARLACCSQYMHTACLLKIPSVPATGVRPCPLCRQTL